MYSEASLIRIIHLKDTCLETNFNYLLKRVAQFSGHAAIRTVKLEMEVYGYVRVHCRVLWYKNITDNNSSSAVFHLAHLSGHLRSQADCPDN